MGPGKGTDLEMGAIETPERLRELLPVLSLDVSARTSAQASITTNAMSAPRFSRTNAIGEDERSANVAFPPSSGCPLLVAAM